MNNDATGHRTPDTGHLPRTVLRASNPDTDRVRGRSTYTLPEPDAGHGTPDTGRGTVPLAAQDAPSPDARDVPHDAQPDTPTNRTPPPTGHRTPDEPINGTPNGTSRAPSRWAPSRLITTVRSAHAGRQQRLRDTADAQRAARDAAAAADAATREALAREAATRRRKPLSALLSEADKIAPIPEWMLKVGVWGDRIVGSLLPTAPLLVSAYFTVKIGQAAPLNMGWLALAFTLGLEGAVWYCNRLREQFKLEQDGTFSLTLAIYGIILLIFGLICGHAIWSHTGQVPINISLPGTQSKVPLSEVIPAIAVAVMSAIGTFVWAKKATYKHRVKLRAMGQIDPRAPKFSSGAWFTSTWETFWSLRHFFKYRIEGGAATVVQDWRLWRATGKPRIWPCPVGFRYENRRPVPMTIQELRTAAERDALVAAITGRDTGQPDTPPATGRPPAGHRTGSNGTGNGTPNRTPDTGATGHGTGSNGTPNGTPDTHPEPDTNGTVPAGNGSPNGTGSGTGSGTPDTNRTPDTGGTPDRLAADADVLRLADYILVVVTEIENWNTDPKSISVRKVRDAIHAHRVRAGEGTFKSMDIAGEVAAAVRRLRENPQLLDLVKVQGTGTP